MPASVFLGPFVAKCYYYVSAAKTLLSNNACVWCVVVLRQKARPLAVERRWCSAAGLIIAADQRDKALVQRPLTAPLCRGQTADTDGETTPALLSDRGLL